MKFLIEDMSCGHCAGRITKAVVATDTTADVRIDIASKIATIATRVSADEIAGAIVAAGYTPQLQQEQQD
jgi:copper chaperone